MPGTTPTYGLPYQSLDDPPHGPSLGEDLAEAVETELARIDADLTGLIRPYRVVQTLAAPASSVSFTGIPSTLTSVTVSWTARSTDTGFTARDINLRVNNDATVGNHRTQSVQSSGTGAPTSAASAGTETSAAIGLTSSAASAAGIWANGEVRFQGWSNPHTSCLGFWWTSMHPATAGTGAGSKFFNEGGGAYLGNGPYNRLDFLPVLGQWATGTQFLLLGW